MADGTLEYAIKLSNSGFLGPLGRSATALGKFTLKAVAVAAPLAAAAAGAGALGVALKSVQKAAQFETLQVGIKNLVGSEQAAKSLLAELQAFEAATPFTLVDDIAPLAQMLLAAKVQAKDMRAEIAAIGNIASATGNSLDRVGAIYAKALGKGVTGEIIEQFFDARFDVVEHLAKTLNKSREEVRKLASEGKISGDVLRAVFQDLGGATGAWGKMMGEQSKTFNGLISTLKGNIDQVMIAFGTPVMMGLKAPLKEAIELVQKLKPQAEALGKKIGTGLSFGFEALKQGVLDDILISGFKIAGMQFANLLASGADAMLARVMNMGEVLPGIMEGVGSIFEAGLLRSATLFGHLLGEQLSLKLAAAVNVLAKFKIPGAEAVKQGLVKSIAESRNAAAAAKDTDTGATGRGMIKAALMAANAGNNEGPFSSDKIEAEKINLQLMMGGVTAALAAQKTAIDDSTEKEKHTKETQDRLNKAVETAKSAQVGAVKKAAVAAEEEGKRRIKLYSKEESEVRRAARRSAADRAPSALDSGFFRSSPLTSLGKSDLLKRNLDKLNPSSLAAGAKAAEAAVRKTVNPNSRALGNSRRTTQEEAKERGILEILQTIADHTEPLLEVAAA